MPCGSCGKSDNPLCSNVLITISGKTTRVESQCPLFRKISYVNANRGTIATPCRNVPVQCLLCPQKSVKPRSRVYHGIWRYNMTAHVRTHHREYASPDSPSSEGLLPLPAEVWEAMEILPKEYESFGIHPSLIPPHSSHTSSPIPRLTQIFNPTPSLFSPALPSTPSGGKRSRAFTNTSLDHGPRKLPRRD